MLRLVSFAEITEHFLRDGLNPAETFRQLTGISLFIRDAAKLLFSFLLFFFFSSFSFASLRLLFCCMLNCFFVLIWLFAWWNFLHKYIK